MLTIHATGYAYACHYAACLTYTSLEQRKPVQSRCQDSQFVHFSNIASMASSVGQTMHENKQDNSGRSYYVMPFSQQAHTGYNNSVEGALYN